MLTLSLLPSHPVYFNMMWKDVLKRDKVLTGLFKFIYTVLSAALPLVLFTMLYKVVLTFEARWLKS